MTMIFIWGIIASISFLSVLYNMEDFIQFDEFYKNYKKYLFNNKNKFGIFLGVIKCIIQVPFLITINVVYLVISLFVMIEELGNKKEN